MPIRSFEVNGKKISLELENDIPLLWILRDHLGLLGTKYSCGIGQCGTCTVHVNDEAVQSCLLTFSELDGVNIRTIEGLSDDNSHPVQKAWLEESVPQCGYCQSGQIMAATALLKKNPNPGNAEIDAAMDRVLCRCGTYQRIRKAINTASKKINKDGVKL